MPTLQGGARSRTVETRTVEEVPVGESQGLGCSPLEWLAQASDEDLGIANVRVYRYDAGTPGIFLVKLDPAQRIDEHWIGEKFGGGTYGVKVYVKPGRSGFDRGVRIDPRLYGAAKLEPLSTSANGNGAAAAAPPPANDGALNRLADILERQNERFERMWDQRGAAAAPAAPDPIAQEGFKIALGAIGEAMKTGLAMVARPPAEAGSLDKDLERLKALRELLPAPAAATAAAPGDMLDQVTKLGALIELVEKIRGNGGGGGDWKQALVEKGLDHIPELVDFGKTLVTGRTKEAEELRKREEARQRSLAAIQQINTARGAAPIPGIPPVAPEAAGEPVSPLHVVPINSNGAAPAPEVVPSEVIPPEQAQEQATMIQEFFKRRIVQLIAEGDEPAAVLDFIDRADPSLGALLTRASEKQIRQFLAADPVLAEITRLPHYEAFLRGLLSEMASEESAAEAPGEPPELKIN